MSRTSTSWSSRVSPRCTRSRRPGPPARSRTEARLPVALVTEALEVEARMQALCEYQLADDPAIKPELDRLRPGTGHRDLANDLLGYARIYELRADVVKADPKHYRADDAARARELAGVMIQKLSTAMTPRARQAFDRYVRVWTLLCLRYEEVRAAALWLWRKSSRIQERFPSLFAVGRPQLGPVEEGGAEGRRGGRALVMAAAVVGAAAGRSRGRRLSSRSS